ncbi:hypothetical protein BLOT_006347 [Blomia tropicalis]|nr:hypothetical protein BLOT_006347 [Blomia tropicalis]
MAASRRLSLKQASKQSATNTTCRANTRSNFGSVGYNIIQLPSELDCHEAKWEQNGKECVRTTPNNVR